LVEALTGRRTIATAEAIQAMRWEQAVTQISDPGQRITLALRPLERALPSAAGSDPKESWRGAARRYFHAEWAENRLLRTFHDVAHAGIAALPNRFSSNENEREVQRFMGLMIPWAYGTSFTIRGDNIMRHSRELAQKIEYDSLARRRLDEVADRSESGKLALAWLQDFDRSFDKLLARTVRQRNAVVHGADTVDEVLQTVEAFVAFLTNSLISKRHQRTCYFRAANPAHRR
jgi:hypothetical protein